MHVPRKTMPLQLQLYQRALAIRRVLWEYINGILSDSLDTGNQKPFWRYVKSQKQNRCDIFPLEKDGVLHTNSADKAQILNDQFSSVFTDNASKCNIMSLSSSENHLVKFYELSGAVLQHVDCAIYLGIALHKSLKFGPHIQSIASKCNQCLGFLKPNLKKCP